MLAHKDQSVGQQRKTRLMRACRRLVLKRLAAPKHRSVPREVVGTRCRAEVEVAEAGWGTRQGAQLSWGSRHSWADVVAAISRMRAATCLLAVAAAVVRSSWCLRRASFLASAVSSSLAVAAESPPRVEALAELRFWRLRRLRLLVPRLASRQMAGLAADAGWPVRTVKLEAYRRVQGVRMGDWEGPERSCRALACLARCYRATHARAEMAAVAALLDDCKSTPRPVVTRVQVHLS